MGHPHRMMTSCSDLDSNINTQWLEKTPPYSFFLNIKAPTTLYVSLKVLRLKGLLHKSIKRKTTKKIIKKKGPAY